MPFVRYARDRRGYETLYVMHAVEDGRGGRARPRVLYACRSVPYARVGRAPLDESVQRRIQTAYPGIEFDWPRLLKEAAASAPRPEKSDKRDEPRKGQRKSRKQRPAPVPQVPVVPVAPPEAPAVEPAPFEVGPFSVDRAWPAVDVIGEGRALVLRGRYIEIAHRVLSRVDDEAERGRLLAEAARLNPEGWTTADEARAAIEGFDAAYDALAARLRQQPA